MLRATQPAISFDDYKLIKSQIPELNFSNIMDMLF